MIHSPAHPFDTPARESLRRSGDIIKDFRPGLAEQNARLALEIGHRRHILDSRLKIVD